LQQQCVKVPICEARISYARTRKSGRGREPPFEPATQAYNSHH
jgi:hypothetical protein